MRVPVLSALVGLVRRPSRSGTASVSLYWIASLGAALPITCLIFMSMVGLVAPDPEDEWAAPAERVTLAIRKPPPPPEEPKSTPEPRVVERPATPDAAASIGAEQQPSAPELLVSGIGMPSFDGLGVSLGPGAFRGPKGLVAIATPVNYPAGPQYKGIEGWARLRITVSPEGQVVDAEVIAAEPPGVFDTAAIATVHRWRFLPTGEDRPVTVIQQLDYTLTY